MTRPILLSNGSLHVGINLYGMVHDFYYPYVGLENHATANNMRHRIGVWVDGQFSWLDDGSWEFQNRYESRALIGDIRTRNRRLGVALELQDCVDADYSAFLRNIHVINMEGREREIRLFMHQVFRISNSLNGDTAQYLPNEQAVLHYKGHRNFVISAVDAKNQPFDQFSVGVYGIEGKEGTYRDAEDGQLSGNAVEHGSVDSVIGFNLTIPAHDSRRLAYWVAAGRSYAEAVDIHHKIRLSGVHERMLKTQAHWHSWLEPAERFIERLEPSTREPFRKSLLIIRSHVDQHGAVIASTDTTMRNYSRDAYAYCWPRDAAYALWPLLRLGYTEELKSFFRFCRNALHREGYLMHKYQADGAIGSSWHPYIQNGTPELPIQEDETAIVIFLFGQYFQMTNDKQTLREFYDTLITPAVNFMANYIDNVTKLPHASYDLWERRFLTTTYTTGVVYAAFLTAAKLAEEMESKEDAVRWQAIADDMREAAHTRLYNPQRKFFYKGYIKQGDELHFEDTIDTSSFYGAFMFGLFDLDSPEITDSFATLKQTFHVSDTVVTPLPRFEFDEYNNADPATNIGNPWYITTLWLAQYYMETSQLDKAKAIVSWVQDQMLPSGVLAEQMNPQTHKFISVAPLIWSQAEFLNSLIDLTSEPTNGGVHEKTA